MKVKQTNTGVLICDIHKCDLESECGILYCPECRKEVDEKRREAILAKAKKEG